MLDRITDYLAGRLDQTGYFEKVYCLAELVQKEDTRFPAVYIGRGQYEHITNIDHWDGLAYMRVSGNQRFSKVERDKMDALCDVKVKIIFPLRVIAIVPKAKTTKDDAFTDERISRTIIASLITDGGDLKDDIGSTRVTVFPDSVTFDSAQVLSEEYLGLEKMKQINYKYSCHAIDLTVIAEVKESCLNTECNEQYY